MTDSVRTIHSHITIDRPLGLVRAHFLDLDHAVRGAIHRDLHLRWLPAREPGERRLSHEARVLGLTQTHEVVVEEEPDGAMLVRFVEGSQRGSIHRYDFVEEGPTRTRVTVTAGLVSAGGVRAAIEPLRALATRKHLERVLAEHKRDVEGSYEPGRARGNLDAALTAALGTVIERVTALPRDAERASLVAPLVEAACVTAVADDEVDDAERDAIRAVIRAIGITTLDDDALEAVIASSVDRTRKDGLDKRCAELGARLALLDVADAGIAVSALVAHVSGGVDQRELIALQHLAHAAKLDDDAVAAHVERIEQALMSTPSRVPPRP